MAFSKARRLGDLVTNTDGDLTAVDDINTSKLIASTKIGSGASITPNDFFHAKADVNGSGVTIQRASTVTDTYGQLGFLNTTTDNYSPPMWIRGFRSSGGVNVGDMSFGTNDTERLRIIGSDGDVGIGTSSPGAKLHVQIDNDSGGIFADANTGLVLKNNSSTDDSAVTMAFQTNQGTGAMLQTVFPNADTNRHGELYVSTANSSGTLAERARFTHEGIRFPDGMGIDFQSTGGGINSSSVASSLFDDYEEGSWTPEFAGVACPSIYGAVYVKIGQFVSCEAYIAGDTQNNSNQFRITGLPYTSANQTAYGGGSIGYTYQQDWTEIGAPLIPGNSSYIYFHRIDGALGANSVINSYVYNKVNANQLFLFQAQYRAAS